MRGKSIGVGTEARKGEDVVYAHAGNDTILLRFILRCSAIKSER